MWCDREWSVASEKGVASHIRLISSLKGLIAECGQGYAVISGVSAPSSPRPGCPVQVSITCSDRHALLNASSCMRGLGGGGGGGSVEQL